MNSITDNIRAEREYSDIISTLDAQLRDKKPLPLLVTGLCEGARAAFYVSAAADMRKSYGRGFLCIVPDEKEALRVSNACLEAGLSAFVYPSRDFLYYNITSSHEFEHDRLAVLSAVVEDKFDIVVTTPDAALQLTIPRDVLLASGRTLKRDEDYDQIELAAFLDKSGYNRVDMVAGAGQYSVRGSIIDIFPPKSEYPARCDFFGDTLDGLVIFDILTQRRIEEIDALDITPAREIQLDADGRAELKAIISAQIKKASDEKAKESLREELEAVVSGVELHFIDKYINVIYPKKECLLSYFDSSPFIAVQDMNAVSERIKAADWHTRQAVTELLENELISGKYCEYSRSQAYFEELIEAQPFVFVETFAGGMSGRKLSGIFNIQSKQTVTYSDNLDLLREDLGYYLSNGWKVVMLCENEAMAKSLRELLSEDDISTLISASDDIVEGVPNIVYGYNIAGYELTMSRSVVMTMYAGAGSFNRAVISKRKRSASKKSTKEKIMSYADLNVGDYIVHVNHGIGQYLGLEKITSDGVTKDYVKISYAGSDMLYLPTNQLDMVSKYIGAHAEDGTMKLSKMGGADWQRQKTRAKAAVKDMAKELIALYAERMRRDGFAFYPDDDFQKEFEASFEYDETDGQLTAVEEIKHDMERPHPMDRLLCGDVGFGKTEVALRAAFKAVSASKQVAILVPTTILALQHYQTLVSRMRGFPIKVDMLSRFRTAGQQQETLRRLRRGEIDIVVGTHRLVSKDVVFKDLGLIIIDEEQRFGVAHKEKLKQISHNVDVLTLTATPIPRTLNMAMSGIRDMSILEEAPGDRFPVQTYVLEYDDTIIAEAIRKELRRGGQVFYLHNRIDDINNVAGKIAVMAGEGARVAVAHGQMDKEEMSDIWRSMVDGETDILVSTTIIETGVDVPNANTLIIDRADRMGLSQLHQIRGRVGRSNRRAYAYFTYPKGQALQEVAEKRLMAIRDFSEFGSGFKIALRDLEIRGAGNLLGAEQHGHIDSIGYDLYMKLLNEAILEEQGKGAKQKSECSVEMNVDAYIPEKYIYVSTQRIDAYKKIAAIENDDDYKDIADELEDRYGKMPRAVVNLLMISLIRSQGCTLNFARVEQNATNIIIRPEKLDSQAWVNVAAQYKGRLLLNAGPKPYISLRIKKGDDPLALTKEAIAKYEQSLQK